MSVETQLNTWIAGAGGIFGLLWLVGVWVKAYWERQTAISAREILIESKEQTKLLHRMDARGGRR